MMATPVERYFDRRAGAYDRRYDHERLQRIIRPSLLRGRDATLALARSLGAPRVLEAGCGPGRLAEALLAAGVPEYVGVDVSRAMVERARARLSRFGDRATLIHAPIEAAPIEGPFQLVVALGLFDYVDDPEATLGRMAAECAGVLLTTFPRWDVLRDPVRTLVHRYGYGCRLRHYDERRLAALLDRCGLGDATVAARRSGFRVTARLVASRD
jgi:SAM-dependent methyltransferase